VDDRESGDVCLAIRTVGDRPVGAHHSHAYLVVGIHTPGEHPYAGVLGLPDHRVGGIGDVRHLLLGDEVHRAVVERDQVPRHLTTPFSAACSGGSSCYGHAPSFTAMPDEFVATLPSKH